MPATGAIVSNFVRNCRNLLHSPASWLCFAILLAIHAAVMRGGGPKSPIIWEIYQLLGLHRKAALSGQVWQLFSYGLLHGSWWHVGFNGVFVLLMGSRIEFIVGQAVFWRTICLGVIGGGIGHLLLGDGTPGAPILVGFSGACLALVLLMTTLSPQSRMMPLSISGRALGLGILLAALSLALVNPALKLAGLSEIGRWLVGHGLRSWFQMGHACHFGGAAAGWLYGRWLLRSRVSLKRLRAERNRREAMDA